MTRCIYTKGNNRETRESKKPVFFENRELAEIDYTETTSMVNFCGIRFKDSDEVYWLPSFRLPQFELKEVRK